jgi:nicotinamidase/pyrazinamidase
MDAVELGFATYLIEDASRGVNRKPDDVARAIHQMRSQGVKVLNSSEVAP